MHLYILQRFCAWTSCYTKHFGSWSRIAAFAFRIWRMRSFREHGGAIPARVRTFLNHDVIAPQQEWRWRVHCGSAEESQPLLVTFCGHAAHEDCAIVSFPQATQKLRFDSDIQVGAMFQRTNNIRASFFKASATFILRH